MDEIDCPSRKNFLGLSRAYSSRDASYFHIVPVPYDGTSTFVPGSRWGPKAIIEASANLELYDHELDMEPARVGIATHRDVPVLVDPACMQENVEKSIEGVLSSKGLPVVLGGEHTVGLGAVRALARRQEFMLVSLDAHADLRDTYQGSPLSHACFLRRVRESVDCCVLGVRSVSRGEMEYAREEGIRMVFAESLLASDERGISLDFIPDRIYLSVDLDVFDPSIMPSTGTPEPGGLDWYSMIDLLKKIIEGRDVLGFDVVELCPRPANPAPDFTAAKLVYKLMGLVLRSSPNRGEDRISHGKEKEEEAARCGGKGSERAD